jgi:hypothetical protein
LIDESLGKRNLSASLPNSIEASGTGVECIDALCYLPEMEEATKTALSALLFIHFQYFHPLLLDFDEVGTFVQRRNIEDGLLLFGPVLPDEGSAGGVDFDPVAGAEMVAFDGEGAVGGIGVGGEGIAG